MRYVTVCGQSQESNMPYVVDRCHNNVQTKQSSHKMSQMNQPNKKRCEPINVTALNGRNQHVGMAYVPGQRWKETYEDEKGFMRGTIFPELDKPFHPNTGGRMQ